MERNYIKFILLSSMALISILAPALGQDGYNLVPADDLLKRIEEGKEVSYDHVIIDGRLDSARLDLDESETGKKIINVPIIIRNSTIKDCVDLNYVMFNKPVYMYNTTFKEHCNMTYSIFKGRADFSHSKFGDNVNFLYTHFAADAFFWKAIFSKDANFWEAYFEEDAEFGSAIFNGNAIFNFAVFNGDGYLNSAIFNEKLNLDRTKFSKLEIKFELIRKSLVYNENTYLKLVENYKSLGWFSDADDCYFHYRKVKQEQTGWGISKLVDIFAWLTCGYGVRPGYTLGFSLLLVVFFGFLYWIGDGIGRSDALDEDKETIPPKSVHHECIKFINLIISFISLRWLINSFRRLKCIPPKSIPKSTINEIRTHWMNLTTQVSLFEALYYSTIVFVSPPHQSWYPNGRWKFLVLIEKVLGWLLLALLIVTLGKIMIR
ncbi:MAG TPA: hypothetical protein PLJ69_02600 [Methanothrix sp.]|nr:hypothetical protein [Methanothrix sp.]HOI69575.1 hypothetical protein [Methanothrix sp.]HPY72090.1 hypothetical protein [Methanothrix sp.]HQA61819.1 hypothetical protein [Methanothrix sp.]